MPEAQLATGIREHASATAAAMRRWLASGALQAPSGAFCAWRDLERDTLAFEYPEITGYALTWLASYACDEEELGAGRSAGDWLAQRIAAGERAARDGWDQGAVYTFDLGMIAAGLISFGRSSGELRYCSLGRSLARELAWHVIAPEGLPPILPSSAVSNRGAQWSTVGRAHLVKCVQALLLADETQAASALVRRTLELIASDGRIVTGPPSDPVMLHPHLYAVEGLWIWGTAQGDDEAIEAARAATKWAWRHQLPTGGLPRSIDGDESGTEQLDVTAQAVRAAVLLDVPATGLDAAVARLIEMARPHAEGLALGYQPSAAESHLNAWATMFGAQALELAGAGRRTFEWSSLV